jgi:hypothetical protein
VAIEQFLHGHPEMIEAPVKETVEWKYFENFWEDVKEDLVPYRSEWEVWSEEYKLAGSIDMIFYRKSDDSYVIYDWKRSKEIKTENRYQSGLGPVMHLPDTNYWHYSLQLNVYRMILKEKYDMDVNELALVILHPNNPTFQVIKVNIMEEEINAMFATRLRALQKPGNDGTNPIVLFDDQEMDLEELPSPAAAWLGSD